MEVTMNQQEYLIKIVNYKGSVVHSWKAPKNRRGCKAQIRKLLRLYWRCKQTNLLTKELFAAIKSYAEALYKLAIEVFIVEPELASLLKEVMSTTIEDFEEEIVAEKMRVHENQKCSFCRTKLVYPAYVVYRKGLEIVKTSAPIGIHCLRSLAGKLNDLVVEIQTIYRNINVIDGNHKNLRNSPEEDNEYHSSFSQTSIPVSIAYSCNSNKPVTLNLF
jgi:hypothetical protein